MVIHFLNKEKYIILSNQIELVIDDLTLEIDKNILKDLIHKKIDYRHRVIRLVAEICKQGKQIIDYII
jgi:hypothetical protein